MNLEASCFFIPKAEVGLPELAFLCSLKTHNTMKQIVWKYGLISGAVAALMLLGAGIFGQQVGFDKAMMVGYTGIILSFGVIYLAMANWRDQHGNGYISFGKAMKIGLLVALISSICYVIAWLIVYYTMMPDFMDKYIAFELDKMRQSGASDAAIAAQTQKMNQMGQLYQNPLVNAAFTFMEPFPIGVVISLLSAVLVRLRKSRQPQPAQGRG